MKLKDLTGKRFNRLLVLRRAARPSHLSSKKVSNAYWTCLCDCGTEVVILSSGLLSKKTSSCGCIKRDPPGSAGFNALFSTYRNSAKHRKLPFDLNKEDFKRLTQGFCYYCGAAPKSIVQNGSTLAGRKNSAYQYNGIDRINNSLGYVSENCVTCCKMCNLAKRNVSLEEFSDWLLQVGTHWLRKAKDDRAA